MLHILHPTQDGHLPLHREGRELPDAGRGAPRHGRQAWQVRVDAEPGPEPGVLQWSGGDLPHRPALSRLNLRHPACGGKI